jgi:uncharacterized protein (DUF2236 family)
VNGPAPIDRAGLTRLRTATGRRRIDPAASLFPPDSITRRVNREAVLLLGGGRALLLQVAHPLVAAGVAEHSRFEQEPLQRLVRTLQLTLAIVFGSAAEALAAVRGIERVHARVRGRLESACGLPRRDAVRRQRSGAAVVGACDAGRQRAWSPSSAFSGR